MGRLFALGSEFFGCGDEPLTEDFDPEPVNLGAGDEGIRRIDEPLGEAETIARGVFGKGMKSGGRRGSDLFPGGEEVAAPRDKGGTRLGEFLQDADFLFALLGEARLHDLRFLEPFPHAALLHCQLGGHDAALVEAHLAILFEDFFDLGGEGLSGFRILFQAHFDSLEEVVADCGESLFILGFGLELGIDVGGAAIHFHDGTDVNHVRHAHLRALLLRLHRGVVEEGEELVVFLRRDGVVLVIMALGAAHGAAEPDRAGGVDAVDDLFVVVLVRIGPGFKIQRGVAMKSGRHFLGFSCLGKEVAGELLDREAVKGHVGVERGDDPVAPRPHVARGVALVAFGVGVAGEIEPRHGPLFAVGGRGEELVDEAAVVDKRRVGEKGIDLSASGWQSGNVEAGTAEEIRGTGFGIEREAVFVEFRGDEKIDLVGVAIVGQTYRFRRRRLLRGEVGPVNGRTPAVVGPFCSFGNPALQQGDLVGGERITLGRHAFFRIGFRHDVEENGLRRIARGEEGLARIGGEVRVVKSLEPDPALERRGVVALEAVFRKEGGDLFFKIDGAKAPACAEKAGHDPEKAGRSERWHHVRIWQRCRAVASPENA